MSRYRTHIYAKIGDIFTIHRGVRVKLNLDGNLSVLNGRTSSVDLKPADIASIIDAIPLVLLIAESHDDSTAAFQALRRLSKALRESGKQ